MFFQTRHGQNIPGQAGELAYTVNDNMYIFIAFLLRKRVILEQGGVSLDSCQRCPEFMGNICCEIIAQGFYTSQLLNHLVEMSGQLSKLRKRVVGFNAHGEVAGCHLLDGIAEAH